MAERLGSYVDVKEVIRPRGATAFPWFRVFWFRCGHCNGISHRFAIRWPRCVHCDKRNIIEWSHG